MPVLVRPIAAADAQDVGRNFIDEHNLAVSVFQTAQFELAVDDVQAFRGEFPGNEGGDFLDQFDALGNLFRAERSGFLQRFQRDQNVAFALGPGLDDLMDILTRTDEGIAPPEAAGRIVAPGEFQVRQRLRSRDSRHGRFPAQGQGRLHDHFIVAHRLDEVRRNAPGFEQFEKVGCKPACDRALAGNFADDDIVARIKNRLAVFQIAGRPIRKDEPIFAFVRAARNFVNVLRLSPVNQIFFRHCALLLKRFF